jgi:hypothetical protein
MKKELNVAAFKTASKKAKSSPIATLDFAKPTVKKQEKE